MSWDYLTVSRSQWSLIFSMISCPLAILCVRRRYSRSLYSLCVFVFQRTGSCLWACWISSRQKRTCTTCLSPTEWLKSAPYYEALMETVKVSFITLQHPQQFYELASEWQTSECLSEWSRRCILYSVLIKKQWPSTEKDTVKTNKQKNSVQPWAEVLSFTHSISPCQSIWTRARQADSVMGFSELTWQNPFWRVVRAEITWQTPAWAGQDLFTQTAIAVSIKGEQEGRYVREVNRVWKVWRGKRRERFRTQHEIMKIWWSAAQLDHALICCDLYHCKAWHVK